MFLLFGPKGALMKTVFDITGDKLICFKLKCHVNSVGTSSREVPVKRPRLTTRRYTSARRTYFFSLNTFNIHDTGGSLRGIGGARVGREPDPILRRKLWFLHPGFLAVGGQYSGPFPGRLYPPCRALNRGLVLSLPSARNRVRCGPYMGTLFCPSSATE